MAPEVVRQEFDQDDVESWRAADIWSLGATLVEMATGQPPWYDLSNANAQMYQIAMCSEVPALPENLGSAGNTFLTECFSLDPKTRPTAARLLRHDFIQKTAP
jgi:serine/threonine protein kinase